MSQSRWQVNFDSHGLHENWRSLRSELDEAVVDDVSVHSNVLELARLKKVVAFLDGLLHNIDPELVPRQTWDSFLSQLQPCLNELRAYNSNKNIAHLVQSNEHADNLLAYIRPFMVLQPAAVDSLKISLMEYSKDISGALKNFKEGVEGSVASINESRNEVANLAGIVRKNKLKVDDYVAALFDGVGDNASIQSDVQGALDKLRVQAGEIDSFHAALVQGSSGDESIRAKIGKAVEDVETDRQAIATILKNTSGAVEDLTSFHRLVFGQTGESGDQVEGGLKNELKDRIEELDRLEVEQKKKYSAQLARIESLLPGATSAGLASAYESLKKGFDKPIALYTKLFYFPLGALVFLAVVMWVDKISFDPFVIDLIDPPNWDMLTRHFFSKLPFVAPVIWLALFSAKRRSQYERLQQEYAHKEALARSYESYRQQIENLQTDSEVLLKELLSKAIDAVAFNASSTLDGNHDERPPIYELLSKLSAQEVGELIKKGINK